jgi:hypothetical protein
MFAAMLCVAAPLMLGLGGGRYGAAWLCAAASVGAAVLLVRSAVIGWRQHRNGWRIDISGVGQIRLTVYQARRDAGAVAESVTLMAGSTLWPGLLLLRLLAADGAVHVLLIWPGNVARQAFRPLSLACRAIAARDGGLE